MITCERCNTENLDGAQYCDECGALLASGTRVNSPKTQIAMPAPPSTPLGALPTSNPIAPPRSASNDIQAAGGKSPARGGDEQKLMAGGSDSNGARMQRRTPAPNREPSKPYAKLIINRGRSTGKEFLLNDDEMHIGRWDADAGIFPDVDLDADDPEAKVSRRHARILRKGQQYFLEDLGSTNGTFINRGKRMLPGDRQPLHDGDEIIIGKTFLRFKVIE